jgi:hypothetical protein
MVVSTEILSQERQGLAPVLRLQIYELTHYPGPLQHPAHSRLFSAVSGLHDILYHRPRAGLSDSGTPARRAETAITTPFGIFEFPFWSFGLRNAAQTFQMFMDEILRGFEFCCAYIDDILV